MRDSDLLISKAEIALVLVDRPRADPYHIRERPDGEIGLIHELNFGDCFSYALARALDEPLLFKGDDFPCPDITVAPSQ